MISGVVLSRKRLSVDPPAEAGSAWVRFLMVCGDGGQGRPGGRWV